MVRGTGARGGWRRVRVGCQLVPPPMGEAAMKMHRDDGFMIVGEDLAPQGPRGGHSGTRTAPSLV